MAVIDGGDRETAVIVCIDVESKHSAAANLYTFILSDERFIFNRKDYNVSFFEHQIDLRFAK